jgi:hypothetical protein
MKRFFIWMMFVFATISPMGIMAQTRSGGKPMRDITHPGTYNNSAAARQAAEKAKTNGKVNYGAIDKAAKEAENKAKKEAADKEREKVRQQLQSQQSSK